MLSLSIFLRNVEAPFVSNIMDTSMLNKCWKEKLYYRFGLIIAGLQVTRN